MTKMTTTTMTTSWVVVVVVAVDTAAAVANAETVKCKRIKKGGKVKAELFHLFLRFLKKINKN